MYKVRTFNQIALRGLERFPRARFEVGTEIADPHAILLRSHPLSESQLSASLRAVARAGAGVNNVPVDACTAHGVVVFNTPGANANSVKELVLGALLMSARDVLGGIEFVAGLRDVTDHAELDRRVEAEKKRFAGQELYGKTLGVVGLGAIGSLVAEAGLRLGMTVLGYDPAISVEAAWRLPSDVQRMEHLHTLFAKADYVSLHVPLMDATRNLVNTESLKTFRAHAVLLNFARQEIVDEAALADALTQKRLRGYFSDFPSEKLRGIPSVRATPHLGASTSEAEENCAVMAADQLIDFLQNGNIRNSVNFPNVYLERTEGTRIAVTNQNVPKMLGQVMSLLANRNINVIDMINKSRGEVAYNLIDIAAPPSRELVEEVIGIGSVLNVRVFET
ncbi:MAG: phosphoglycerate dehydrogenase [Gammaproteobacteria bacterium]|nr:phosphoglycerate dehydrogenase [Gammaproteobacteria bacterium]